MEHINNPRNIVCGLYQINVNFSSHLIYRVWRTFLTKEEHKNAKWVTQTNESLYKIEISNDENTRCYFDELVGNGSINFSGICRNRPYCS